MCSVCLLWVVHSVRSVHASVRAIYLGAMCACSISFRVLALRSPLFTPLCALRSLLPSALFTPLCTLYSQLRSAFRTLYSVVDSALYLSCVLIILECCTFSVMHLCIFYDVFVYSLCRDRAFSVLYLCICCAVSVLFCAVSVYFL